MLVANLPYNIATPLVMEILDHAPMVSRMLVMVQREVGDRFCAAPGTPAFGAVSVKVASRASARMVGTVPSTVFLPQPKVESALIEFRRISPEPLPNGPLRTATVALLQAGFAHRRKMLRGALAGRATSDQLIAADIRPEAAS